MSSASKTATGAQAPRTQAARATRLARAMAATAPSHHVKDLALAPAGVTRVEWADRQMPVLAAIRERFERERPLEGYRVSACLHVTTETANLARTLQAGGADVLLCASNPLSTQDDAAAALVAEYGVPVFAIKGEDDDTYYAHITAAVDHHPQLTMDDGADVIGILHSQREDQLGEIVGGTEETTTGVIRLRALEREGRLGFPIVAVNEAKTKYLFDNRYGTGQSTIDGIIRATNVLLAGRRFVVCGYGWVGRGVAMRARGMGAHVIVTEVEPLRALEALMDGLDVMPVDRAAEVGDIFCTATGDKHVLSAAHFERMKDGAILANTGHFNVEIEIPALRKMAVETRTARPFVEEFRLGDGRRLYLLAEGRLVNLGAAEGHPAAVMDMSFANQALSAEFIVNHAGELERKVYVVPEDIDREIARLKLETMGVEIDQLTAEQARYLASWDEGT
jgi:adenosylhomocysteinase